MEVTKLSENAISVSKVETQIIETNYEYDYLVKQRASIEAQKAQQIADRDKELAEIDALLAECVKFNVVAKPIVDNKVISK